MGTSLTACVTGGSGFIGSCLVRKLLHKGYRVHATMRNLGDAAKTDVLKNLPGADEQLSLFEADIYDASTFEPAIQGCDFVFLVASPLEHNTGSSKFEDTCGAAGDAIRVTLRLCERAGTVKRIIYTGSVVSSSPINEGLTYKDFMDESCWTPLTISVPYANSYLSEYMRSKTLSEKEFLSYKGGKFEVVSLVCGLVGGDTLLSHLSGSMDTFLSPLTGNPHIQTLNWLQTLAGSLPVVHVEDVCEAQVFCIEKPSLSGRFLCAATFVTVQELLNCHAEMFPEIPYNPSGVVDGKKGIQYRAEKLKDLGFSYKYGAQDIWQDTVLCARRLGVL